MPGSSDRLAPRTAWLGKLILLDIYLSIKLNIGHAWLLGPHALGKLITFSHYFKY